MYPYVEHGYIVVGYFIDGGAARRLRKYKGGDGLEKIFPQLKDDEPEPVPSRKPEVTVERSGPVSVSLVPDQELSFVPPEALDLSLKSPGGVDLSGIDQLAQFLAGMPRPVMPTRADLLRMGIDEFERSSEAYLNQLLNTPDDFMDAVLPRKLNG